MLSQDERRELILGGPAAIAIQYSGLNGSQQWAPYRHLMLLNEQVLAMARGDAPPRLLVTFPNQHGKTEFVGGWLPPWALLRNPHSNVIFASYAADYAHSWGEKARDRFRTIAPDFGLTMSRSRNARKEWGPAGTSGGMRSLGMGGGITGAGGEWLLLDDTIKNNAEAESAAFREKQWAWFRAVWLSRRRKNTKYIVTMSRWHADDLIGRIKQRDRASWAELHLPALAFQPGHKLADGGIAGPDPLGREPGQALCPDLQDRTQLLEDRRALGPVIWGALKQGDPADPEGTMFSPRLWTKSPPPPRSTKMALWLRCWDFAGTQDGGDFTAGVLMSIGLDKSVWIWHVDIGQVEELERRQVVMNRFGADDAIALAWGHDEPHVKVLVEREGGSAGKDIAGVWGRQVFSGRPFEFQRSTGSKVARARQLQGQQMQRNVHLVQHPHPGGHGWIDAPWFDAFIEEARTFPGGRHDDQIDAASKAYLYLAAQGKTKTPGRFSSGRNRRQ